MTASGKSRRPRWRWLIAVGLMIAGLVAPVALDTAAGTVARHAHAAPTRSEIVAVAAAEIGNSEANGGCTKYGPCRTYDWCAMFVEWVWNTAGVDPVPTTWVARAVGQWGVENGSFKRRPAGARGNPLPGDIVVYGEPGTSTGGHVSLVHSVHSNGAITTIDGNYNEAVVRRTIDPVTARAGAHNVQISGYVAPNVAPDSTPSSVGGSSAALYRDSVQFFARAAGAGDGAALFQKAYVPGEGWRDWVNLGGGITGRPSVVEHNGSLQAFARAPNGAVYQKAYVPGEGWRGWVSLGGNIAGDPVAISDGTALHIFARVPNGAVYHKAYVPGEGWRDWENLGGEVTGGLAVAKYGDSVQVYARVANGAIYQKAYVPGEGWRAWTSLGGVLDSDPSVAVSGTALHIAARAPNGATYLMTYTPATGWRDWESLGGEVTGNPTAVQHGNSLQIYGRAPNGAVYQKAHVPGEGWRDWVSLGGNIAGDPVALSDGTALHIFARVPNGALHHKAYVPGGWREWENLGGNIH